MIAQRLQKSCVIYMYVYIYIYISLFLSPALNTIAKLRVEVSYQACRISLIM